MQAFALLTFLPLLAAIPRQPYGHSPSPPNRYGGYHHQPSYGYEKPKHNCSVEDVNELAEVCTPALETNCELVDIPIKKIVDAEYCYESVSTVCQETEEVIDNEVCTYSYNKVYEDATARTVEVSFERQSDVQMVTVCQPGYGYGHHHGYGHQYCKEVAQETQYNVPIVNPRDVPVRVGFPVPEKSCVNKPITLPRISCETVSEQKCINQPQVEDVIVSVEKCIVQQGPAQCQRIELTLPKQVCKEIVYGYAEDKPEPNYSETEPRYTQPEPTRYSQSEPPRYPQPKPPRHPETQPPRYPSHT